MSNITNRRLQGLSDLTDNYECLFCDVWGVVHNGVKAYEAAVEALTAFRNAGGRVVLLTNSPRPHQGVIDQLRQMDVGDDAYDAVVTSGDATRTLVRQVEGAIFHLGPERDKPLFAGMDVVFADEADCDAIVCTGLFDDENEDPKDYKTGFQALVERDIPFICANPDLVVERGDRLIYCAGSLAKLYSELGGRTLVAGKPHAPIYDLAMNKFAELAGNPITKASVIAIGDGMPTDVAGAEGNGFDLLYITGGIHHSDYGPVDDPDTEQLGAFLDSHGSSPTHWMPRLYWKPQEEDG